MVSLPCSFAVSPQREGFGPSQTQSLLKLWRIEGSTFVEALANRRL